MVISVALVIILTTLKFIEFDFIIYYKVFITKISNKSNVKTSFNLTAIALVPTLVIKAKCNELMVF